MLKPGDCVMSGAQAVASMTAVDAHKPSEAKSLKAELLNLSIQASAQLDTCARTLQQMRTIIDDMSAQHTGKSKPRLAR